MKKELIQLLKGKNAYIQTHDFPDPDALATAFALQEYLKYYGIEATICYEGKLERASAIRMLDNFGIQVKGGQTKGALPEDACVVLVDSQNQNKYLSMPVYSGVSEQQLSVSCDLLSETDQS